MFTESCVKQRVVARRRSTIYPPVTPMNTRENASKQVKLAQHQIEAFYSDRLTNDQIAHFQKLVESDLLSKIQVAIDVGGGCGHFSRQLAEKTGLRTRVIDSDWQSIENCKRDYGDHVEAEVGDALKPQIHGDEDVVCFNLILHHLVGPTEMETRALQKQALIAWREQAKTIFINEYIYDSYIKGFSGRMIYEVTRSSILSAIGRLVSIFMPSLKANTFGIGVRFRGHQEWIELFEECGFILVKSEHGRRERISLPRRILLIKNKKRDSFLLCGRNTEAVTSNPKSC